MRTVVLFLVAFFVGIFVQATLLHSLFPDIIVPDMLLMLVVYLGVRSRTSWGAFGAFLIGIGGDFASAKYVGPFAGGSVVAFTVTVFIANHLFSEKGVTLAFTAFAASLAKDLTAALIVGLFTSFEPFSGSFFGTLFLEALFTAAVCPLVMWALTWGHSVSSYGPAAMRSSFRRA